MCGDNTTYMLDATGTNCPKCPDGITPLTDPYGSNCASYNQTTAQPATPVYPSTTSSVFLAPVGSTASADNTTCPKPEPCQPCGRCPEPSFKCKKVPNYAVMGQLPVPVLNDFSQFGM